MDKLKLNNLKENIILKRSIKIYIFLTNLIILPGAVAYAIVEARKYPGKVSKIIRIWAYLITFFVTMAIISLNGEEISYISEDTPTIAESETIDWEMNEDVLTTKDFVQAEYTDNNAKIIHKYVKDNDWINVSTIDLERYQSNISNDTCYFITMSEEFDIALSVTDNCYNENENYQEDLLSNGDEILLIGDYLENAPLV